MAIVIPSSNIYDKKNSVVLDNALSKIEVEATKVSTQYTEGVAYSNENIKPLAGEVSVSERKQENYELSSYRYHARSAFCFAYAGYIDYWKWSLVIHIPKTQIDKKVVYLNNIYANANDGFSSKSLTCTIFGTRYEGIASGDIQISANSSSGDNVYSLTGMSYREGGVISEKTDVEIMNNLPEIERSWNNNGAEGSEWYSISAKAKTSYKYDVAFMDGSKIEDLGDTYRVTLNVVAGATALKLKGLGYKQATGSGDIYPDLSGQHSVDGSYTRYEPKSLSLSLYGKIIEYKIDTENMVVKNYNTDATGTISISKNEFIQSENVYEESDGTGKNAVNYLYGKVLTDYTKGKETATIECPISDYDENDGSKPSIRVDNSTEKMTFEIGDKVIPMVYVGNGEDKPMSKYNNGQPKVFEVLGVKMKYEGVPRQILGLQEVTLDTE